MNIKDKNYITIQGWMRTELDLSGNDLIVYALIYGFCQSENQKFNGSLQYIADWCGATKQGVMKNLQNLLSKNLIVKESRIINGVNSVTYYTTEFNDSIQQSLTNNIADSIEENNISNTKVLDTEKEEEKESFLGSAKSVRKPKKQSLYDKCYAEILAFTNNVIIQEILTEYLKFRLSVKEKPLYLNQWRGMLNKLSELSEGDIDNMRRLAQQSLEKTWLSFYPLTNTKSKSTMLASCEKNVRSDRMTEDDEKKQSEFIQKLKEEGKRIEF